MCPAPAFPLQPGLLSLGWRSLCCAAANDDACALLRSSGDRCFVFTLDCRVRDLKDVEDSHRNVVDQVGQGARHADKSYLAGLSELQECFERAVLLQGLPGWRGVELHDVEIVGFHPHETLFDPRHHVLAGEDVWPSLIAWSRRRADQTSAFAGQIIFSPPVRDITPDPFLAQPVIDRVSM